jgi:hypothetical protein
MQLADLNVADSISVCEVCGGHCLVELGIETLSCYQ